MLLLWILVLVVGIAYLAHRRTAPLPALGVVAVYLLAMGAWSHAPGWLLLVFWVLIAIVAAPLLLADLAPDVHAGHIVTIDLAPQDPAVPWGFYMSRLTLSPAVRDTLRDATGRMLASGTYRQIAERHYPGLERLGIRLNEGKTVR